ncbi:931_t:CDS:2 [Gigaspora margarita]|uniref:931_t:CDS:1 n=1 Tax=Gigaspora margarita TaxID=4874 RepID=A0ABM8W6G4_GIGMA|nr:931_t:CDS:2 [Gigaspora margarita]
MLLGEIDEFSMTVGEKTIISKAVVTKEPQEVNKKENNEESKDESTDSERESKTEVSEDKKEYEEEKRLISQIYLYCKFYPSKLDTYEEAYLGEKKRAQVKKYNLGKMLQEQRGQMKQILQKYEDIFVSELDQLGRTSIVQHEIFMEKDPLIKQRFYLTSRPKHKFIGQKIRKIEEARLIHSFNSPWVLPVMLVKKKIATRCFKGSA